jgi:hypothetical protein
MATTNQRTTGRRWCRSFEVSREGEIFGENWVTAWENLPVDLGAADGLTALGGFRRGMLESLGGVFPGRPGSGAGGVRRGRRDRWISCGQRSMTRTWI